MASNSSMISEVQIEETRDHRITVSGLKNGNQSPDWREELEKLVLEDKWDSVVQILQEHPEAKTAGVTRYQEVPLAVALRNYKTSHPYIGKLVELMTIDDLSDSIDIAGNTILHALAWHRPPSFSDAKRIAKILIEKHDNLPFMFNNDNLLPVDLAKKREDTPFYLYLFQHTSPTVLSRLRAYAFGIERRWKDVDIKSAHVDAKDKQHVADQLQALAVNLSLFQSGSDWKSLFWLSLDARSEAIQKLRWACSEVMYQFEKEEMVKILKASFFIAAANGNHKVVEEIIKAYPDSVEFEDEHKRNFFEIGIVHRREKIIGILDWQSYAATSQILSRKDEDGNNVLHLMARKPFLDELASKNVIFQMQSEMQWFEKLASMRPKMKLELNNNNKSPLMVFEEEHQDMAQDELSWIFSMATSCSVAASIIATLTFTSVIAVPGGNNDQGFANFIGRNAFTSFIIFDSLALVSSLTSLISFLSIFTSRYGASSFLKAIPDRVIFGLVSMILSIIFLVIGFGITILLGATSHKLLVLLATVVLGSIPILTLVYLQLPSLSNMITPTYGHTNFMFAMADRWIKHSVRPDPCARRLKLWVFRSIFVRNRR